MNQLTSGTLFKLAVPLPASMPHLLFLMEGKTVVYVTGANNVFAAYAGVVAAMRRPIPFTHFVIRQCDDNLSETIASLIVHFKPRYNKRLPQQRLYLSKSAIVKRSGLRTDHLTRKLWDADVNPVFRQYYEAEAVRNAGVAI